VVLLILESLGTSELILIGILALVLLGPRKLPEIAQKAGKLMAEFRGTAAEFKETWTREVNFEEEAKALKEINFDDEVNALRLDEPDIDSAREPVHISAEPQPSAPSIKEADPSRFEGLVPHRADKGSVEQVPLEKDKKNWL
jgi:Tat protein translocase TatB subunit